jgi:hypothetical protein
VIEVLESYNNQNNILQMVRKRKGDKNHYYFYWVVEDFHEIEEFEKEYTDAYNLKYAGMLRALKRRIR